MLSLKQTELYGSRMNSTMRQNIEGAVSLQLARNIGVIAPNQIEPEILQLKAKNKKMSLHSEALSLYESQGGRIRLFNLATNVGKTAIPPFVPFTVARVPANGIQDQRPIPAVFMNMYRMGAWNLDDTQYLGLNAQQDLYCALETGIIMYKMIVEGKSQKVFENANVLQNLTRIYSFLFSKAVGKTTGTSYGKDEFHKDLGSFIISKFFLYYCLQKKDIEAIEQIAFVSCKAKSSLLSLQENEKYMDIDYNSLSGFLSTFGEKFLHDSIKLAEFERAWLQLYGEGTALTIEYVPYLIHFLFAALRGTSLGNSSKFTMIRPTLDASGLGKLYLALISVLQN